MTEVNTEDEHPIPPMTDPLGRHWNQPSRESILIDADFALMTKDTFERLSEYSTSRPSGVYPGKMWRRHDGIYEAGRSAPPKWLLAWYGHGAAPDVCSINWREVLLV